ncbi:MAG: membrane integrity-associated transporter subunit PqiC [Piscirickettsiaceae bacterium]|nr:membrane integrity-associated transporter subunit PqiC [Piscirickettsiaceae bacterium]
MLSVLTGCLGLGSKDGGSESDDSLHYYVIDVDRGSVASSFVKNRVLRIQPIQISSHFRGQTLVFKVGDNEFQAQENHQFFSDPQDMFTEQLKRWLQKSGLFSQVIIDEDIEADMVLEIAVTALYGDNRDQFSPQAVLEMQFFLTTSGDNTNQTLFQTGLRIDINIDEITPSNVVKGWKQGLEELLATVEDDFRDYFSKRSP